MPPALHFSPAFHTLTPKLVAEKPITHNGGYLRYQELVHSNNLLHQKPLTPKLSCAINLFITEALCTRTNFQTTIFGMKIFFTTSAIYARS